MADAAVQVPAPEITDELREVVRRHGDVVARGDQRAILADFRADRIGQLVASADLPADLVGSQVLDLEPQDDGLVAAYIRYTAADGQQITLRSRWIELPEGWRVTQVRNIPDTPPDLGTQGPSDDGLDVAYWEGLRDGVLRMQRCARCATWIWSPRPLCPACRSFDLTWPEVAPVGRVFSWTRTWQPFAERFVGHLPFVTVLVEVRQAGGRRLLGALLGGDGAEVSIGADVVGEIDDSSVPWPVLRWRLG